MAITTRIVREMVENSGRSIDDEFHHIGVGSEWYEVYRLQPTLWRVEQYGEFLFNLKAGSLRILIDVLSRIRLTEYKKDSEKRNKIYKNNKTYIKKCMKIYEAPQLSQKEVENLKEMFLSDKYVDKDESAEVKAALDKINAEGE